MRVNLVPLLPAAFAVLLQPAGIAAQRPAGPAVTDHVILISLDGLRPDAIAEVGARHLTRLQAEGAWSLTAQTILPSKTLPSHTSMVTGVEPAVHGVTWNDDRTDQMGPVGVATIFDVAHAAGLTTAGFFGKAKFNHFDRPGSLDHFQAPGGRLETWPATRTVADVVNYLHHRRPNLLMVHIGEPDYAGHSLGWGSFLYRSAVRRADGAVGRILEAADEAFGAGGYTVIVTADHGGHGRDHGSADAQDTTIPWIAWGRGIHGGELEDGIRTTDTAATVLRLLGLPAQTTWAGVAVSGALEAPVAVQAAGG